MLMMIIIVMIGTVSGELALSGYVYSHNLSTKSRHWSNASICYLIIVPRVDINKILASQDEVQQPQQMVRSDGGEAVRIDIGRSWWWWWWWWVGSGWGGMSYEEGSTAAVDRDRWRIALPSLSLDMASEHNSYKHWVVCFALRLSNGRSNSVEALPSIVVNSRRSSLVVTWKEGRTSDDDDDVDTTIHPSNPSDLPFSSPDTVPIFIFFSSSLLW